MPFQRHEYRKLQPLIGEAKTAAVLTHVHPDGDGVGSGLALARFLRGRGLDARFLITHKLPLSLQFLAAENQASVYDAARHSGFVRGADLIFTVDNSSVSRLGPVEDDVRAARGTTVCIDHHLVRNGFWKLNLIDRNACATGEMIHDCILELGGTLDRSMAESLYTAIWTDTGGFRYPKTTGRIHRMVADLLDLGVDPMRVYHELNERNTPAGVRLLAAGLQRLQLEAGGRLAWVSIPADLVAECRAEDEDTGDIIVHLLAMEGVEIGLLFREEGPGRTKISLRSRPRHDVNALATAYGGGGHKNAAGAVLDEPLEACARRVVADALALLA